MVFATKTRTPPFAARTNTQEPAMPRFMLVDDDYGVLSSLRRCLHQMPAHSFKDDVVIDIFERPQLALARAAETEYDIVIADWHMPDMDGLNFMTQLLQLQPDIARLIMSADDRFRHETAAIEQLKIFHFICKPWNPEILRVLLRLALVNRPARLHPFHPQRRPVDVKFQQFAPETPVLKRFAPDFRVRDIGRLGRH
jgi:CheY-like chemotaxis protein